MKSPVDAGLGTGAGEWTRTTDLLITNQLLYQLSYTGMKGAEVYRELRACSMYWPPSERL